MNSTTTPSTTQKIAKKLALSVVSLAVSLALIELAFRILGVHVGTVYINRRTVQLSPDPELSFALRPGSVARAEVEYRINSLGLRGPETSEKKPDDRQRILVLGDSIPFGYWVAVEDAFPLQLQQLANEHRRRGPEIEVVNLGVSGYNLRQEAAWLSVRGVAMEPDLVVFSICLNDLESFSHDYGLAHERAAERSSPSLVTQLRGVLLDVSLLASWIEYRLVEMEVRRSWASDYGLQSRDGSARGRARRARRQRLAQREQAALTEAFGVFASILRTRTRARGLVVLFPGLDYDFEAYPHGRFHQAVARAAANHGLPFLDLMDCYRTYRALDMRVDPSHPSPMGHRVAAHAILEAIQRDGLLGPERFETAELGPCDQYRAQDFPKVRGY